MNTLQIRIEGMHCASCAMLIDDELEDLAGVTQSDTSYVAQRAKVVVDTAVIDVASVVATVEALGYRATPGLAGVGCA